MSYSGNVQHGSPQDRELAKLIVTKVSVGEMDNNAFLLQCRATGDQLLIDAAAESDVLLQLLGENSLSQVVTTHRHPDHWGALSAVVSAKSPATIAGAADVEGIPVRTDRPVEDGDVVSVGRCQLEVISLAGHTPGSIALLYDDPAGSPHLWTGDSLFPGGPGRTTDTQSFLSLMGDLEAKVFDRLPDETWFYPGHGNDSTLGEQRPQLSEWRGRGW